MPLEGENELERFVDKYGYNTIWTAITQRLLDGSRVSYGTAAPTSNPKICFSNSHATAYSHENGTAFRANPAGSRMTCGRRSHRIRAVNACQSGGARHHG